MRPDCWKLFSQCDAHGLQDCNYRVSSCEGEKNWSSNVRAKDQRTLPVTACQRTVPRVASMKKNKMDQNVGTGMRSMASG